MNGLSIKWDKYSLILNDERVFVRGGEFHYWRAPDRDSWRDILKMYKIAGLNTVRIYFHWGYHSPKEGNYNFEDNRDVDYLLSLCEDLGLYVLVAAGPYICAETSAGGFPFWLLKKRDIRLKHLKGTLRTEFDPEYMNYCREWYENFIPHIIHHQVTENPNGCIIGFQIENEYFEKLYFTKGIKKYMRTLINYARDLGVTVPTFHNDAWESGSWNGLVDLYGFDKYVIHAPKEPDKLPIPDWSTERFSEKVDNLENTIRDFGNGAAKSPIFIPELQGGWFNHWGIDYGYDELYDFYGSTYQKMLETSIAAQGSTMMSLYMFYGGTSWGSIPDPDVYTSYDYSACIREYRFLSERLRNLRLFNLFIESFAESFYETALLLKPDIESSIDNIFLGQRRGKDDIDYYFIRNFNKNKKKLFKLKIKNLWTPKNGNIYLDYKDSYIAVGNINLNGFKIKFCSAPIIAKGQYLDGKLLVLTENGGEVVIEGTELELKGNVFKEEETLFSRILINKEGYAKITNKQGNILYLIVLSKENSLSLNTNYNNENIQVAWGLYSIFFDKKSNYEVEVFVKKTLFILDPENNLVDFELFNDNPIPSLKMKKFEPNITLPKVNLSNWEELKTHWDKELSSKVWKQIDFDKHHNPLDHLYTCGHVLYKCEFIFPDQTKLKLKLNIRNKCAIWLNGIFIGGDETYSIKYLRPGAKNGPDPTFLGSKKYDLSPAVVPGKNILFIITENLGYSRTPFFIDDTRNPRGIISKKFNKKLSLEKWYISGIDVAQLTISHATSGLPGENFLYHLGGGEGWRSIQENLKISPGDQIKWFKSSFDYAIDDSIRAPLRLHVEGKQNTHIYLNGVYIGKYWGRYGPQHDFYLMDGLIKETNNQLTLACWTIEPSNITISIEPYRIDEKSGNKDENGKIFQTKKFQF